jgi:hypothetical protein
MDAVNYTLEQKRAFVYGCKDYGLQQEYDHWLIKVNGKLVGRRETEEQALDAVLSYLETSYENAGRLDAIRANAKEKDVKSFWDTLREAAKKEAK